jgi:hypothetical protein
MRVVYRYYPFRIHSTRAHSPIRQEETMPERAENRWEGLNAISGFLAALAIPVVLAILGHRYTNALKEREIQGRFVEIAVDILEEPPNPERQGVRRWAIKVVNEYSGVPMDSAALGELKSGVLVASQARVYLLAGSPSHATRLDSVRSMLVAQGVNVVGQNAALQDETRVSTPEIRYFNAPDSADANAIAARVQNWLGDPSITARLYRDPSAKPGYVEVWLGH